MVAAERRARRQIAADAARGSGGTVPGREGGPRSGLLAPRSRAGARDRRGREAARRGGAAAAPRLRPARAGHAPRPEVVRDRETRRHGRGGRGGDRTAPRDRAVPATGRGRDRGGEQRQEGVRIVRSRSEIMIMSIDSCRFTCPPVYLYSPAHSSEGVLHLGGSLLDATQPAPD